MAKSANDRPLMARARTWAVAVVAALAVAPAGCKKAPEGAGPAPGATPPPAAADPLAEVRPALGGARLVPADVEGYFGVWGGGPLAKQLAASRVYNWLTGGGSGLEMAKGLRDTRQFFHENPDGVKLRQLGAALFGEEFFAVLAPGFTGRIAVWKALADELRIARLTGQLVPADPVAGTRTSAPFLVPLLGELEMPPIILGFRAGGQRVAVDAALEDLLRRLPAGAVQGAFDLGDHRAFRSVAFELGQLADSPTQIRLETALREAFGDPRLAKEGLAKLLTRRVECAFGWVDDYFLVSLGSDRLHLRLAASEGESLLALPGVVQGRAHLQPASRLFGYESDRMVREFSRAPELLPFFLRFEGYLSGFLKTPDLNRLRAEIERLDQKARAIAVPDPRPIFSYGWWDEGARFEVYGGQSPAGLALQEPRVIGGDGPPTCLVWWRAVADAGYAERMRAWFEDLVTTVWGLWQQVGVAQVPPAQRQQIAVSEQLIVPKVLELYRAIRDEFWRGLGPEGAFALDLAGKLPPLPKVSPSMVEHVRIPRFAVVRSVADAALIGQSSRSCGALLGQTLSLLPPQIQMMGPLLSPVSATRDGLEFFTVPALSLQGDIVPHTALGADRWLLGTAPEFSAAVAGSLRPATPADDGAVALLRIDTQPVGDWYEEAMKAVVAEPEAFFPSHPNPGKFVAEAKPKMDLFVRLIRDLGIRIEWRLGGSPGAPRQSLRIDVHDLPPPGNHDVDQHENGR